MKRWIAMAIPVALVLAMAVAAAPAVGPQAMKPTTVAATRDEPAAELTYSLAERQRVCEEVWRKIGQWYSYFDDKGIDWESVKPRYLALAAEAKSDREFFACISSLLRELHDGHSYVYEYPKRVPGASNLGAPRIHVVEAEGKPIVAKVAAGSDGAMKGVMPGMEIVSIDAQPVEERISALIPLVTASTPWHARGAAVAALLNGSLEQAVKVELRRPDGAMLSLSLAREPFERESEPITARILDGGIGLLRLPSFSASNLGLRPGDALTGAFDDALEQLKGTKALIIDMRGNGGGDDAVAARCAGRLVKSTTSFPSCQLRMVTLGVPWFAPRVGRRVSPRGPWQYTGPVVLLIDEFVFSSAEHFVAGMHDSGRAVTIGHTTAGSSGNPICLEVSGFRFQVSRWREYRADGSLIEGHGVPADIAIRPTITDIANGVDTVLAAALVCLKSQLP